MSGGTEGMCRHRTGVQRASTCMTAILLIMALAMILFTACEGDPAVSGELASTAGDGSQEKTGADSQGDPSSEQSGGGNPENPDDPASLESGENPENPESSDNPTSSENPENEANPENLNPEDPKNPESPDDMDSNAQYYQNGVLLSAGKSPDFERDVKKLVVRPSGKQLTDYPKGYEITFPDGMEVDFSLSPDYTRVYGKGLDIRICRDRSPYLDVTGWLSGLPNGYVSNQRYIESNHLSIHEDGWMNIGSRKVRLLSLTRNPAPGSTQSHNSYTYAYINTQGLEYYTIHFRSDSLEEHKDTIYKVIESFKTIEPKGNSAYRLTLKPRLPEWNEETAALYEKIRNSNHIWWGFFTPNPFTTEGKDKIAEIEEKLDFRFPVIMWYRYLGHDFPLEGMQDAHQNGKLVELTYQIAKGDLYGKNPNFEVLDGLRDDEIRKFARQAKEFSHPFLFRLNNEMNSTWVSYSGHSSLADPDVYRQVWQRVYRIFEEEGVDNAIWIFNPNDISYPPCKWNTHLAYYPGNEYVHMIGLTGYNTGDYFRNHTGERWRSFTEIYDRLWYMYRDVYSEFPWIITEFACSSVGGDKEAWITDMFANLPRYKNIKIAVWWSYYDEDPRPETKGTPARRYWLDEKPEYLDAFKRGLSQTQPN